MGLLLWRHDAHPELSARDDDGFFRVRFPGRDRLADRTRAHAGRVTIGAIITLALLMITTAKVNWVDKFASKATPRAFLPPIPSV